MVKLKKSLKGVTLVELIMLIAIVAIIGAISAGAIIPFVQIFLYSPRQLDTQNIAGELTQTMLEGNSSIRGMRYARTILDASDIQFSYTYGYPTASDQLSVRYRWNAADSHIYQSTSTDGGSSWSTEVEIPYHIAPSITIDGTQTPGVIFTYKKAADADWVLGSDDLADIRRVVIAITVKSGTGNFTGASEGSLNSLGSAEIKGF